MHKSKLAVLRCTLGVLLLGVGLGVAQSNPSSSEMIEYDRQIADKHDVSLPKAGVVPDAETAKSIAMAVSIPVWGKDKVTSELPLHASMKNGVWTVVGDFHPHGGKVGGELIVQVNKKDGRILSLLHTQ